LSYFKLVSDGIKVALLVGNIQTAHSTQDRGFYFLNGATLLNDRLAKDFENLSNIKVCHLGDEFYGRNNAHAKRQCLEEIENLLDKGYFTFIELWNSIHYLTPI
jgi:hypothetical protein